jgi:hypothetical protein
MDELVVEVPVGFRDQSVQALEWRLPDGGRLTMSVVRQPKAGEESIDDVADRIQSDVARSFAAFVAEAPAQLQLPIAAASRRARLKHEGEPVYRHFALLDLDDRWLILSASGPVRHGATVDEILLGNVRRDAARRGPPRFTVPSRQRRGDGRCRQRRRRALARHGLRARCVAP